MSPHQVRGFGHTYVGRRSNNEDCLLVRQELGLFAVADGMGGYEGGEVASNLATDVVHHFFERVGMGDLGFDRPDGDGTIAEALMDMAFRIADREVRRERVGALADMGTTLAVLLVRDGRALVAHVGDSRIYRLRQGELEQLTLDHSLSAVMDAAGIASATTRLAYRHVITRAVGAQDDAGPDIRTVEVRPGDRFLLCTDGLTDVVDDTRIAEVLRQLPGELVTPALVGDAWLGQSKDNITAVLVDIEASPLH